MTEFRKMGKVLVNDTKVNMQNKDIQLKKGNLSDGLNDVAKYLGLEPSNTLFMNSTVVNDSVLQRRIPRKPLFSHSLLLSYLSRSIGSSAKGICLHVNDELLEYLDTTGIAPKENLIHISQIPKELEYPYISVAPQFKKILIDDIDLRNELKNYTIISSYLSNDEVEIANLIDGKLLMDPEKQIEFNSKYYFRKNSSNGNYSIPLGVCFMGLNEIEASLLEFKKCLFSNKIDYTKAKFWCKFESQSNGEGSFVLDGLTDSNIQKLKEHIICFSKKLEYTQDKIQNDIPLVLEIDVNSLPYESEIANIGVEAVIAENQITLVGCVIQHTRNGRYIGCTINNQLSYFSDYAEQTAIPAFINMQKHGYRGFMTMDVLLTCHSITHEIKGYNIDPNARFTDGTTLLSLLQYSENQTNRNMVGISFSNSIKDDVNLFDNIKQYAGDYLYQGKGSDYEGIIPIIVNDLTTLDDGKRYIKTVVIGNDMDKVENMYSSFKKNIINHLEYSYQPMNKCHV